MKYWIAIEPKSVTSSFGVVVPDLPGCFSAGDSLEEAQRNAVEAIKLWIEATSEAGETIPIPRDLTHHQRTECFSGWDWRQVDIGRVNGKDMLVSMG